MHRFLRFMICLLVICAMVVQVSPIQAHAISTGVLAAAAISVTIGTLIGLGISTGADTIAHTELAQEAVEVMKQAGYVTAAGTMALTSLGSGRYGVRSSLVESLFSWIYETGTVRTSSLFESGITEIPIGNITVEIVPNSNVGAVFVGVSEGTIVNNDTPFKIFVCFLNSSPYQQHPGFTVSGSADVTDYYTNQFYTDDGLIAISMREAYGYIGPYYSIPADWDAEQSFYRSLISGSSVVITDDDITLNFVANPELSLAEGYPEWAANSVVIDGETYYPVAVAPTFEETQTFTQADVWAGNGTITDTNTGTGSGTVTVPDNATLKDILTGVLTIPQAISIAASNVVAAVQAIPAAIQAIPAAIADFFSFKPPPDHNQFALVDLKDFFPFCIPFDLYAFFQLLDADPVAPVLSWEIPDLSGQVYSLSIDLAEWDSVALLFRRLQLFLFITGLAAASRKFIKW